VVKLDVREDERVGKVVHELRALVEEGGVVLVAFDDEGASVAEAETGSEVLCDASDEKRRREAGLAARGDFVDPGQHAGGGGLAVGSGDDQRFVTANEFVVDQARQRGEGDVLVEHKLDFRIAARDGVADNDEVRRRLQIGFRKWLGDGDAELAQKIGHGRIRGLVRAGDAVTLELQQPGERGHCGAADSDEVDVLLIGHFGER
jgi:hypothetical protein